MTYKDELKNVERLKILLNNALRTVNNLNENGNLMGKISEKDEQPISAYFFVETNIEKAIVCLKQPHEFLSKELKSDSSKEIQK